MSVLPDPPSGISHARRGLRNVSGDAGGLHNSALNTGKGEFEANLIDSVLFTRNFYEFNDVPSGQSPFGASGPFIFEKSDNVNTDFEKVAPTATRQSHIISDITVDDSQVQLITVAQFLSGQNPWIEVGFELESVTELGIQIGFADPGPADAGKIVDDVDDTPTVDALITDCAMAVINTDDTIATLRLISKDGTTVTGVTGSPTAAPHGVPTLATNVVYRVELRGQTAYCFVNGTLVATSAATAGPQTSVLLEAVIQFGNLHTTDKEVHINYIDVGQERLVTPF